MNLFCNGAPKAGNHALVKACELLGVPAGDVNHTPFSEGLPAGTTHHLFIKRDPRNVVLSMARFRKKPVTPGTFISTFRKFDIGSLVEDLATYEGWLTDANTVVVKFEDLIGNMVQMEHIATYLGVPYLTGAFEALPGLTLTYNAQHSDYNAIWTPDVDAVWQAEGGPELLKRWGY